MSLGTAEAGASASEADAAATCVLVAGAAIKAVDAGATTAGATVAAAVVAAAAAFMVGGSMSTSWSLYCEPTYVVGTAHVNDASSFHSHATPVPSVSTWPRFTRCVDPNLSIKHDQRA